MNYRRRIYFTSEQKAEIRDRWQRGESMSPIGLGFVRHDPGAGDVVAVFGRVGQTSAVFDVKDIYYKWRFPLS